MTESTTSSTPLKIGIIGFGPFAQFLSKTMIKQGHKLSTVCPSDDTRICSELGVKNIHDMNLFLGSDNDVILFSTSIMSFAEVLHSMPFNCLKKPTLFVDVLSVKEYPRQLFLQVLPEEADVLCTHPMFGPVSGKDGWKGLTFMYEKVRIRDEDACSNFLRIFEDEGCRMVEMSCEEHDRQTARSQFLTHTIGRMLSEMEIEPTAIDTKSFETLLHLKNDIVQDSLELYSGLFFNNRFAQQVIKDLEHALGNVKEKLLDRRDHETESR